MKYMTNVRARQTSLLKLLFLQFCQVEQRDITLQYDVLFQSDAKSY